MTDKIRKIMGASLLALAFSLVCGGKAQAQSCLTQPSCDTLGYKQSASDCSGIEQVLKCPFDQTKMFCLGSGAGETGEVFEDLVVGAILYEDKTVATGIVTDKTPIGIVFNSKLRLAVALRESPYYMAWGGEEMDIPALDNCDTDTVRVSCGINGKTNTAAILAYGKANNISYPAAEYCNKYTTAGTKVGDWHLPSLYELKSIFDNRYIIGETIRLLKGTDLDYDTYYWSSTESYSNASWGFNMYGGHFGYLKNEPYSVRPVIAF